MRPKDRLETSLPAQHQADVAAGSILQSSSAGLLVAPDSGVPQDNIKDEPGKVAIGSPCLLHGVGRSGAPQNVQQVHKL